MRVLVGITGGIAAYKAAEVIRIFKESGHEVRAVPTANALRFIGTATLEALTHNPVSSDLYSEIDEVRHIELAKWADLIVVAPATASFIARMALGIADDLLGNVILATTSPIVIAPAMHTEMWQNAATTANVSTLQQRGVFVIDPAVGRLTGSDTGVGRLPDAAEIVTTALNCVVEKDLAGKRILVVAGGTIEPIDPVRFIGNKSSGKQGIALVEEALSRGAEVTLIAANFSYTNRNAVICAVSSTAELLTELNNCVWNFDAVVMPAAVSDFRVASPSDVKLKKSGHDLELSLVENPDVISHIASLNQSTEVLVIGFAAETASGSELVQLAQEKLKRKQLDYIVANDVSGGAGFDSDENTVYICDQLNSMQISGSKRLIAAKILDLLSK